jgi:hypothetical protein
MESRRPAPQTLDSDSVFPPEPGSFCSKPTPVVPASEELRAMGTRSHPPNEDGAPRPSSRPTASFGPAANAEQAFWQAAPAPDARSLPPEIRPRSRSRSRAVFSKLLFLMLFGGIATLLGYAVKKKLDARSHSPSGSLFIASDAR